MIKNNKIFVPPPNGDSDIKALFKQIAAAGAGRPLDNDGFPAGPWTPELLSEAILHIDPNRNGVDLRTVQLWFQDNDKGISTTNLKWLARILGCDDPEATNQWQVELVAAQIRLTAKRRDAKKAMNSEPSEPQDPVPDAPPDNDAAPSTAPTSIPDTDIGRPTVRHGLARKSEAIFTRGSPLDLPASVFAGTTALGFLSFMVGIHDATYVRSDGLVKQVGFFWAPNWTILFMVFLPLYFAFVVELLAYWKKDGRLKLVSPASRSESDKAWARNVEASSNTFWAVFLICVLVAGLVQWIGVSLIPLIKGSGSYAIDWGKLTLARPEVISVPTTLVFTGLAYLYMCFSFYIFFAGLILLYTLVQDLWRTAQAAKRHPGTEHEFAKASMRVMSGVFRCTILGIIVASCMKAQSAYLASNGRNIVSWLVEDGFSVLHHGQVVGRTFTYRMPTHYSSLLIAISTCVVFAYAALRLGSSFRPHLRMWKRTAIVGFLMAAYLLIDAFPGFSILLGTATTLALYGLVDPELRPWRTTGVKDPRNVP